MPYPGQRITNPLTGERIVFQTTSRQLDGNALRFDVRLRPGGVIAGAPHRHPHEERFHVTQGRLGGWIAGQGTFTKEAGESFVVPSGVDHVVLNPTLRACQARVEAVPGGEFDRLLESTFDVSRGHLGKVGEAARLMRDECVRITGIPRGLQDRLMTALSRVGARGSAA
jgi:quercetin dioxygenase-like cupin family protein